MTNASLLATDYLLLKGPVSAGLQTSVKSTAAGSAVIRLCNGTLNNIITTAADVIAYAIVR